MATITKPLTDAERADRQRRVDQALASIRLEGLEPSDGAKAIFGRYASGELTLDEMGAEIEALNDREFGPVRLPRH